MKPFASALNKAFLSIRTQQIAQLETGIARVADPLGGSYYIEWLTNEIEKRVSKGEIKVVGVNCFRMKEEPYQAPVFRPNPRAAEIQKEKLERLKKRRDNKVEAYATLGEIVGVWRRIYPRWRVPLGI